MVAFDIMYGLNHINPFCFFKSLLLYCLSIVRTLLIEPYSLILLPNQQLSSHPVQATSIEASFTQLFQDFYPVPWSCMLLWPAIQQTCLNHFIWCFSIMSIASRMPKVDCIVVSLIQSILVFSSTFQKYFFSIARS